MKTVILMGAAYKFSKKSWRNFLEKWCETGIMPEIDRYATLICRNTPNITDWSADDAKDTLTDLVT